MEQAAAGLRGVFAKLGDKPDDVTLETLEEKLLETDMGPQAAGEIVEALRHERQNGRSAAEVAKDILRRKLNGLPGKFILKEPLETILIMGINGAGKTTTVAKLANHFKKQGRNPVIASADTFRAAANEQLMAWASMAGVPLIESSTGADPAAVAYDALAAAKARGHDTLLIDTAGRLHTKEKLMEELKKIERVMKKIDAKAPTQRILVLDATLGLNSLAQAQAFAAVVEITGIIVTKLDSSAKAGFLVGLYGNLKKPVFFAGLGEGMEDLREFELEGYLEGLVG